MTAFEQSIAYWKAMGFILCTKKNPHRLQSNEFLLKSPTNEPYTEVLTFNHGRGFDNYGLELRFNADGSFHSHYVGFI